jgi:hypothetical protein
MNDLIDALEHLSARGTPRGADAVFAAAVKAARHTDPSLAVGSPGSSPSPARDFPEYVSLTAEAPHPGTPRRLAKITLAAAAAVALFATGVVIANSVDDDSNAGALHDVSPEDALPLAQAAGITPDKVGSRWRQLDPFPDPFYAEQAAATIAAFPECAMLRSFGLFPPTTKAVAARQAFTVGNPATVRETVFVFATAEDALRAMDVIEGDIFPACWFQLYDRLAPFNRYGAVESATSSTWDAPDYAQHGDRQVIFGQQVNVTPTTGGPFRIQIVNAFVQVGRAISWLAPSYWPGPNPPFQIDRMIAATATALDSVFNP